jgi:hypothetical protein
MSALLAIVPDPAMTPEQLADALGIALAQESEATKRRKAIRDALEAFGDGEYNGARYRATVKTAAVKRISPDLVRELLSPDDVELVTVTSDTTTVRCVARNGR